jgi:hypothetical protein
VVSGGAAILDAVEEQWVDQGRVAAVHDLLVGRASLVGDPAGVERLVTVFCTARRSNGGPFRRALIELALVDAMVALGVDGVAKPDRAFRAALEQRQQVLR